MFYCDTHHRPIPETMSYYERKAKGGAASVCVGDAIIDGTHGLHGVYNMKLDDPEMMPVLNKLSTHISRHGAVATLEMYHTGQAANVSAYQGHEIYGPQDGVVTGGLGRPAVKAVAMTREVMDRIVKQHRDAAELVKSCGFGMIMLHGAHGFMFNQFMAPSTNHRTDEYGGSFENCMRFPLECIRAVRETVGPDYPLEIRISAREAFEGGYDVDYACKIAEALDGLVDLIHVSGGSHEEPSSFNYMCPSMFHKDNQNVEAAIEIKKHVKKSKVAVVAALNDLEYLDKLVGEGKIDVVEFARALLSDPDMPLKARYGREDEIRTCMRCYTCFSNLITHGHIVCALNPETADEFEHKFSRLAPNKKKILVVGGGVAGMEAAITAANRGHEVILCEKNKELGGVLLCEEKVPFKKYMHKYLRQQAMFTERAGVDIRLSTEVSPQLAREIAPDVILLCTGQTPVLPPIPGIKGENVVLAETAYTHPESIGKKVVIMGAGLVGAELAVYLDGEGKEVTVIEMQDKMTVGDNKLHGMALKYELASRGVDCRFNTRAVEINENGVVAEDSSGRQVFEADTVVCALGLRSVRDLAEELRNCAPEYYEIGDCVAPNTIYEATRVAHNIALDIGERI